MRTHKAFDESTDASVAVPRLIERRLELREMVGEIGGDLNQPAIGTFQVLKVQRSLWSVAKLRGQERKHLPAHNRALDFRGRIHADHGGAVINRVKVVRPGGRI